MPEPCRLYSKARFVGFKRSRHVQQNNTSILQIEGVHNREDADFYLGKRVAFIYRASKAKKTAQGGNPTKIRVIWGKVTRPHGNTGAVRAKFTSNLPPRAMGATLRVMLYPSRV